MAIKKYVLGIDPGKNGGWALFIRDAPVSVGKMPIVGNEIDVFPLCELIRGINGTEQLVVQIEKVHSMPQQGVSSTFTFGVGYGKILGLCQTLRISHDLVTPNVWKKRVLQNLNKDKEATIEFVSRAYPEVNLIPEGCRVPHDGIADAICIAKWGYDKHVNQIF